MLKVLDKRFNSDPPSDKIVNGRKLLAKFIGLSLYKSGRECVMTRGPECSIEGPCCLRHRAEGIREAHDMFNDLLKAVEEYIADNSAFNTTIHAIQIELKVRVVVDHLSFSASLEENLPRFFENLILKYFNGSSYVSDKLNARAAVLRDIVQNNSAASLPSLLESKYPFSLFESNLRNFLKSIDALFPPVVLTHLMSEKLEKKVGLDRSASDILSISRSTSKLASPTRDNGNQSARSLQHTPVKQAFSRTFPEDEPMPHSPIQIISPKVNKRSRSVMSPPRKLVANIAAPEVASDVNPFAGVKIQGKFFRGVIEPNDERFAAIADGTDAQVKQYLLERARNAAASYVRAPPQKPQRKPEVKPESKISITASTPASAPAKTTSMLDRHASAERIAWESQLSPVRATQRTSAQELLNLTFEQIHSQTNSEAEVIPRIRLQGRARRRFSDEETANLIEGYKRFGADWKSILKHYKFDNRTNVDLKDKARNLMKHNLI